MNNIKIFRQKLGISQQKLAVLSGLSYGQIGHLEAGSRRLNQDNLTKLAEALNCKPEDLISENIDNNCNESIIKIKYYDESKLDSYTMMSFSSLFLEQMTSNFDNLILVKMNNNTMESTIKNGDLLFADTSIDKISDGIFALNIDGEIVIRRLQKLGKNKVKVILDNSSYESMTVDSTDVIVEGMVKDRVLAL